MGYTFESPHRLGVFYKSLAVYNANGDKSDNYAQAFFRYLLPYRYPSLRNNNYFHTALHALIEGLLERCVMPMLIDTDYDSDNNPNINKLHKEDLSNYNSLLPIIYSSPLYRQTRDFTTDERTEYETIKEIPEEDRSDEQKAKFLEYENKLVYLNDLRELMNSSVLYKSIMEQWSKWTTDTKTLGSTVVLQKAMFIAPDVDFGTLKTKSFKTYSSWIDSDSEYNLGDNIPTNMFWQYQNVLKDTVKRILNSCGHTGDITFNDITNNQRTMSFFNMSNPTYNLITNVGKMYIYPLNLVNCPISEKFINVIRDKNGIISTNTPFPDNIPTNRSLFDVYRMCNAMLAYMNSSFATVKSNFKFIHNRQYHNSQLDIYFEGGYEITDNEGAYELEITLPYGYYHRYVTHDQLSNFYEFPSGSGCVYEKDYITTLLNRYELPFWCTDFTQDELQMGVAYRTVDLRAAFRGAIDEETLNYTRIYDSISYTIDAKFDYPKQCYVDKGGDIYDSWPAQNLFDNNYVLSTYILEARQFNDQIVDYHADEVNRDYYPNRTDSMGEKHKFSYYQTKTPKNMDDALQEATNDFIDDANLILPFDSMKNLDIVPWKINEVTVEGFKVPELDDLASVRLAYDLVNQQAGRIGGLVQGQSTSIGTITAKYDIPIGKKQGSDWIKNQIIIKTSEYFTVSVDFEPNPTGYEEEATLSVGTQSGMMVDWNWKAIPTTVGESI